MQAINMSNDELIAHIAATSTTRDQSTNELLMVVTDRLSQALDEIDKLSLDLHMRDQ